MIYNWGAFLPDGDFFAGPISKKINGTAGISPPFGDFRSGRQVGGISPNGRLIPAVPNKFLVAF